MSVFAVEVVKVRADARNPTRASLYTSTESDNTVKATPMMTNSSKITVHHAKCAKLDEFALAAIEAKKAMVQPIAEIEIVVRKKGDPRMLSTESPFDGTFFAKEVVSKLEATGSRCSPKGLDEAGAIGTQRVWLLRCVMRRPVQVFC